MDNTEVRRITLDLISSGIYELLIDGKETNIFAVEPSDRKGKLFFWSKHCTVPKCLRQGSGAAIFTDKGNLEIHLNDPFESERIIKSPAIISALKFSEQHKQPVPHPKEPLKDLFLERCLLGGFLISGTIALALLAWFLLARLI